MFEVGDKVIDLWTMFSGVIVYIDAENLSGDGLIYQVQDEASGYMNWKREDDIIRNDWQDI